MNKKLYKKVEKWLETHTFHHSDFLDEPNEPDELKLEKLIEKKKEQRRKISVVIPTLNEEDTIGKIVRTIKEDLIKKYPLVDEIFVIDSGSTDKTELRATKAGAKFKLCESLTHLPVSEAPGKGTNLWASLFITKGDIISWVDADIKNFHSKFVYGPIGILLENKDVRYAKGFYKRPLIDTNKKKHKKFYYSKTGGGRVTELTFRATIGKYFPELVGFIQPLSGEYAGTREILEKVPFYSGYGVETGLLINILDEFGLESMAQVDLDIREHSNQDIDNLRKMAFVLDNIIKKEARKRKIKPKLDSKLYIPSYIYGETNLEEVILEDKEQSPAIGNRRYKKRETKD